MTIKSDEKSSGLSQWRSLFFVLGLAILLRWGVVEPRWIPSESMQPGLQPQDRVLVYKLGHRLGLQPKRDAVVVFQTPEPLVSAGYDPQAALIKRVVGIPGDELAVHAGELWRNGRTIKEPWAAEAMEYELPELTLADGELMVLGDNRNESLDSHLWGPLPESDVIGTAFWRYWPPQGFGPLQAPEMG